MARSMLAGATFALAATLVIGFTTRAQQNVDWDAVEISTHHVPAPSTTWRAAAATSACRSATTAWS